MRLFKANYWLTLIYNGLVLGIWPGAALGVFVTHIVFGSDSVALFIAAFIACTAIMAALVMCSYHFFVGDLDAALDHWRGASRCSRSRLRESSASQS